MRVWVGVLLFVKEEERGVLLYVFSVWRVNWYVAARDAVMDTSCVRFLDYRKTGGR